MVQPCVYILLTVHIYIHMRYAEGGYSIKICFPICPFLSKFCQVCILISLDLEAVNMWLLSIATGGIQVG